MHRRRAVSADVLISTLTEYGYWILFAAILLDCAGLPVAGELLLVGLGAGVRSGVVDPAAGFAVATVAALGGHSAGYWFGRLVGPHVPALARRAAPGPLGVLFSRFLVGVRVVLAPLAGASRMPFPTFVTLDLAGAGLWVLTFGLFGYAGGLYVDEARTLLQANAGVLSVAGVALFATLFTARVVRGRARA